MKPDIPLDPVVMTFARYGYRKTAMDDVARALGISRRGLYNRFGSKQALAEWATGALIDRSAAEALRCIGQPSKTLVARLVDALDAWVGRHIDALHSSPHGRDVIAMLRHHPPDAARAAERRIVAAMTEAIRFAGPGSAVSRAGSMAQALCWTARGLVHALPDHAGFRRQMEHIVAALVAR